MLKVLGLVLFWFVLCGADAQERHWSASYRTDIIIPCQVSLVSDEVNEYWKWRVRVGVSSDVEADISVIYERYKASSSKVKIDSGDGQLFQSVAFCDAELLGSKELAKLMNLLGSDTTPRGLYYRIMDILREDQYVHLAQEVAMPFPEFRQLLELSISREVDYRFPNIGCENGEKIFSGN